MMIIFGFCKFFVVLDGISTNDLFQDSALKATMGSVLKVFLQLWFACAMCQCFARISFNFDNVWLYVTDNGMCKEHCV